MATFASLLVRKGTTPSACQHGALPRSFTPGGQAFDATMQDEAWAFLAEALPPSI
jgi:hypothetical protein